MLLRSTTRHFILLLLLGCSVIVPAQDIHFSQFYNSPLNLNPALTGMFSGDQRFQLNYRNQWFSVPVPYTTISGAYDQKFYQRWLPNGLFGGGLIFNYDQAGDAKLSWAQLGLNLAYTHQLADEVYLSGGFLVQFGQRAFEPARLRFDDQYNGDIFDESIPSLEAFPSTSIAFLDLGAGLNISIRDEDSRSIINGGFSFRHLNQPQVGFLEKSSVSLPMVINGYALATVEASRSMDVVVNAFGQFQGPYREMVAGAGVKYHVTEDKGKELALLVMVSYRSADALIAHFEVFYQNWHLGLSYDINISAFTAASNSNGGPEVSLRHIITKVKPPETFKACPIF